MGIYGIYSLVMTNIAIENNCFEYFFNGKINYFDGHVP